MKMLLVVFAVFTAVFASEESHVPHIPDETPPPDYLLHGVCGSPGHIAEYSPGNPFPLGKIVRQTSQVFEAVFEGHCDVEGGSFMEYFVAKETECLDLFLQSYCYTQLASSRTGPNGLSFEQLDQEIPDIGKVTATWCSNKCSEKILKYVWRCYTDPKIKHFVVDKIAEKFDWVKNALKENEPYLNGTPIGRILLVGFESWKVWADVGHSIKINRPAILKMFGDLRFNFADFCDAKCYEPSVSKLSLKRQFNKPVFRI